MIVEKIRKNFHNYTLCYVLNFVEIVVIIVIVIVFVVVVNFDIIITIITLVCVVCLIYHIASTTCTIIISIDAEYIKSLTS